MIRCWITTTPFTFNGLHNVIMSRRYVQKRRHKPVPATYLLTFISVYYPSSNVWLGFKQRSSCYCRNENTGEKCDARSAVCVHARLSFVLQVCGKVFQNQKFTKHIPCLNTFGYSEYSINTRKNIYIILQCFVVSGMRCTTMRVLSHQQQ